MWETIREDSAGELTVLLQQDSSRARIFRLAIAGFEDDERITRVLDGVSMEEAAQQYIKYREDVRNKGISALVPLDLKAIVTCSECNLIKEHDWWLYCPRCGTKFTSQRLGPE